MFHNLLKTRTKRASFEICDFFRFLDPDLVVSGVIVETEINQPWNFVVDRFALPFDPEVFLTGRSSLSWVQWRSLTWDTSQVCLFLLLVLLFLVFLVLPRMASLELLFFAVSRLFERSEDSVGPQRHSLKMRLAFLGDRVRREFSSRKRSGLSFSFWLALLLAGKDFEQLAFFDLWVYHQSFSRVFFMVFYFLDFRQKTVWKFLVCGRMERVGLWRLRFGRLARLDGGYLMRCLISLINVSNDDDICHSI